MINRDCAIVKLLKETDVDVRLTMFDYSKANDIHGVKKLAWLETIKKAVGKKLTSSSDEVIITLTCEKGDIISAKIAGEEIITLIRLLCDNPIPIRISITPKKAATKVFIFA